MYLALWMIRALVITRCWYHGLEPVVGPDAYRLETAEFEDIRSVRHHRIVSYLPGDQKCYNLHLNFVVLINGE